MENLALKLNEAIKEAMKAREKERLEALRSIKSAVMLAQTEKAKGSTLSDDEALKLLQRLQKQRKDSMAIYEEQNRQELAATERQQLAVIEEFLPRQMSDEDLHRHLQEIITRTGAQGPKDMGKVMGTATRELAGKADGQRIAAEVKKILSA